MDGHISNIKKWNIIYPIYINSKKTIAEGRRISAAKACENPTCLEIADCCNHFKIPNAVEVHLLIYNLLNPFTLSWSCYEYVIVK